MCKINLILHNDQKRHILLHHRIYLFNLCTFLLIISCEVYNDNLFYPLSIFRQYLP